MNSVLAKTFGGLSGAYYFRQLMFCAIFPAFFVFLAISSGGPMPFVLGLFLAVSTLLYPYSRFVYDSIVDFVIGDNVFVVSLNPVVLFLKCCTMALCWCFAIFVAPIGLAYLFFHHTRAERQQG
jgi:hypothetical protein